jgi:hypothetical protein
MSSFILHPLSFFVMTFLEYLSELPLDDLKRIASVLELRPSLISRARLIREIPDQMFQPGFIEARVDGLDAAEQDLLLAVLFAGEKGYACDVRTGRPDISDALYTLLTHGLIIGRRGPARTPEYIVPSDIRETVKTHIARRLSTRLSAPIPPVPADETEAMTFIRDLFSLLSGLRREPARLTDRGTLYKRAQETLLSRLEFKETVPSSSPQSYPGRLDLMIHYTQSRRLLYEEESRFRCSAAFAQWLHLPTTEKLDDLLAFWYGRNHGLSPRTSSLLAVLQLCIDFDGIDPEAVTDLVLTCTPGLSPRDTQLAYNRQWVLDALRELEWLGLLRQYGDNRDTPAGLVITPLGRNVLGNRPWDEEGMWSERFVVQPTFEIIVPCTLHLAIRNELEKLADLAAVDVTMTYRITRDTIYRAGDEGLSGAAVLAFLERHSEKTIPQNVEYTIREWGDSYGQVYFMDTFLLRTASPEIAGHIRAHPDLAGFVRGQVAPDALIVERHEYREMMEALRKAGFMPKSQIVGMEPERDAGYHPFARERFADVWTRYGTQRMPHAVIGFDECLPGYQLKRRLDAADGDAAHLEQAAVMQYLSPRHTEELLEFAINYNHTVMIDYYIGNRSRSYLHKIRPIRIERTRGAPYLEAHRVWEDDVRIFRVAHIKAIRVVYDDEEED